MPRVPDDSSVVQDSRYVDPIATAFGEQGATLAIPEIATQAGDAAARAYEAPGIRARAYQCDVATYDEVQRAIAGLKG